MQLQTDGYAGRDVNKIIQVAHDIAKCIQHLHDKNLAHCDLKPQNIVIEVPR